MYTCALYIHNVLVLTIDVSTIIYFSVLCVNEAKMSRLVNMNLFTMDTMFVGKLKLVFSYPF